MLPHNIQTKSVPGTIGYNIRKYRELRDMSQRELGIKCGFTKPTAATRISQYECSLKVPSKQMIKTIADALEIDEETLTMMNTGKLSEKQLFKILFELESQYGLHPCLNNEKYGLEFNDKPKTISDTFPAIMQTYLKHWYNKRKDYEITSIDSEEEIKQKETEYEIWKGKFPQQTDLKDIDYEYIRIRKKEIKETIIALQKELEDL